MSGRKRKTPKPSTTRTLPAFAWPGGYPILYVDRSGSTLCPDCANAEAADGAEVSHFIHWEGEPEVCESCNKQIDSAYGPPDKEV